MFEELEHSNTHVRKSNVISNIVDWIIRSNEEIKNNPSLRTSLKAFRNILRSKEPSKAEVTSFIHFFLFLSSSRSLTTHALIILVSFTFNRYLCWKTRMMRNAWDVSKMLASTSVALQSKTLKWFPETSLLTENSPGLRILFAKATLLQSTGFENSYRERFFVAVHHLNVPRVPILEIFLCWMKITSKSHFRFFIFLIVLCCFFVLLLGSWIARNSYE